MAIQKTFVDNKGVSCSYYRIGVYAFNAVDKALYVNLFGYADASYREKEKQSNEDYHVSNLAINLPLSEDDTYSREKIYNIIMAMPEFEGSTSV